MKVSCPSCSSNLNIDDKKIPAGGARIKCPTCQNVFPVKPAASSPSGLVPLPGSSPSGAVPLPGITAQRPAAQQWEEESTRVADAATMRAAAAASIPGATTNVAPPSNVGRPPAVPLPGITAQKAAPQQWEEESTRVVGDVPLPGAAAESNPWQDEETNTAAPPSMDFDFGSPATASMPAHGGDVPLPGGATAAMPAHQPPPLPSKGHGGGAVPLPGGGGAKKSPGGAVPLPGGATAAMPAHGGGAVPLPGGAAAHRPAPGGGAVPLPGGSSQETYVGDVPGGNQETYVGDVPLPGGAGATAWDDGGGDGFDIDAPPTDGAGVPLPGGAANAFALGPGPADPGGYESDPGGFDFDAQPPAPVAAPGSFDFPEPTNTAAPGGFDFDAQPPAPAAAPGSFDFGEVPAPAPVTAPGSFDFAQAPAPASQPSAQFNFDAPPAGGNSGFDFNAAPPAPASSFSGVELGAPPPAQDFSGGLAFDAAAPPAPASFGTEMDYNSTPSSPQPPPPTAPAMAGFGEVDFGGGSGGRDDLEFDPTGGPPRDDLEADLSAPIPSSGGPAGPADGLEMLSFIDQTAKEAGAPIEATSVRRFSIKRRSGKIFGPFEDAVITKMLEEGQLLGNEEISADGESWQPIGTEPTFQQVIARLMEQPARSPTMAQLQQIDDKPRGPSMEKLKQLYEGRMAAVAVVESKAPVPLKKKLPFIAAGVLVVAIVAAGVGVGLATPYGFFATKLLFPAKIKPGSREAGYLAAARKDFLVDTYKTCQDAKSLTGQALQVKEYPEARAVWVQAVMYLKRRYGTANPSELARAASELPNLALLGEKHPEVLKAEAGVALTENRPDAAIGFINTALADQKNQGDLELFFLRAEAYLMKKQLAQAKSEYEAILKKEPTSARAMHGLGMTYRAQNELVLAAEKFKDAVAADATHVSSSVELAELLLLVQKKRDEAEKVLGEALSEEHMVHLSPAEKSKALALKADLKVADNDAPSSLPLFEAALKEDPQNAFAKAHLGAALVLLHQPDKALPLFADAAKAVPDNLDYTDGYLTSLITVGKMDEATKVVAAASQRFPGNAKIAYLGARVSDALDKAKEAEEGYKRAIAADPDLSVAYLYLSRLYMRFRRYTEARPELEKGLEKDPNNAQMRVGMGELALAERDLDTAEREFKLATQSDPTLAEAYLGLSKVALDQKKYDLANAHVERALELNPRVAGGRLQKGTALWRLSRLDEAITELEQAKADEPRNIQITVTLGAVEFEKGNLNNALQYLTSALQAEPGHANANFYLARVKNARAEHTQAIEAMKRALDYDSKNPLYHYWMGRLYKDARKLPEAVDEWRLALEAAPDYADALQAMGEAYADRNDYKRAVQYYEQTLKADPSRVAVIAAIGDAQMKREDYDAAIKAYTQALEADDGLAQVYARLGDAWREKKKWPKATEWYRKAVAKDPKNAEAWRSLGWMYKEQKKKPEALKAFKAYLKLVPEAEDKKMIADEIYDLGGKDDDDGGGEE